MASDRGQSSRALHEIVRYTTATRRGATNLAHAYRLGVKPGRLKPWPIEFQRAAVAVWLETCPDRYVAQIGLASARYAAIMRSHEPVNGPDEDWAILLEQAEGIATVVAENVKDSPVRDDLRRIGSSVPAVIRYDKLAALATKRGVGRLEVAAETVAEYCRRSASGDITPEEIDWLIAMADGQRTADTAAKAGVSERAFYRALRRLWKKLGVANRAEAIALASRMGWLDED